MSPRRLQLRILSLHALDNFFPMPFGLLCILSSLLARLLTLNCGTIEKKGRYSVSHPCLDRFFSIIPTAMRGITAQTRGVCPPPQTFIHPSPSNSQTPPRLSCLLPTPADAYPPIAFLSYLRLSVYMTIVSIAIVISFHLKSTPSALELRIAKPLGFIFWILSVVCLGMGCGNYIKTVNKYGRRAAIVQTGWKTQTVSFLFFSVYRRVWDLGLVWRVILCARRLGKWHLPLQGEGDREGKSREAAGAARGSLISRHTIPNEPSTNVLLLRRYLW